LGKTARSRSGEITSKRDHGGGRAAKPKGGSIVMVSSMKQRVFQVLENRGLVSRSREGDSEEGPNPPSNQPEVKNIRGWCGELIRETSPLSHGGKKNRGVFPLWDKGWGDRSTTTERM